MVSAMLASSPIGKKDYRAITDLKGLSYGTVLAANKLSTIIESQESTIVQQPKYFTVFDLHSNTSLWQN